MYNISGKREHGILKENPSDLEWLEFLVNMVEFWELSQE